MLLTTRYSPAQPSSSSSPAPGMIIFFFFSFFISLILSICYAVCSRLLDRRQRHPLLLTLPPSRTGNDSHFRNEHPAQRSQLLQQATRISNRIPATLTTARPLHPPSYNTSTRDIATARYPCHARICNLHGAFQVESEAESEEEEAEADDAGEEGLRSQHHIASHHTAPHHLNYSDLLLSLSQ